jgi:hypothetical protein
MSCYDERKEGKKERKGKNGKKEKTQKTQDNIFSLLFLSTDWLEQEKRGNENKAKNKEIKERKVYKSTEKIT